MKIRPLWTKLKSFINESGRVLRITKKPDKAEFLTIVKASALGMAAIGLIGFIIQMTNILFFK
ncbi:protein translocase SEC61 complex subunit gamma [Candidatus Woesearchaeota archaeon]|nr:protein translocase SEC61 complex subunit gamma [Candidatus Woesearchaeota archaeon]